MPLTLYDQEPKFWWEIMYGKLGFKFDCVMFVKSLLLLICSEDYRWTAILRVASRTLAQTGRDSEYK